MFAKPKTQSSSSPGFQSGLQNLPKEGQDTAISYQGLYSRVVERSGISSFIQPQFVRWKLCPEANRLLILWPWRTSFQLTVEWHLLSTERAKKRPPEPPAPPSFLLIKQGCHSQKRMPLPPPISGAEAQRFDKRKQLNKWLCNHKR